MRRSLGGRYIYGHEGTVEGGDGKEGDLDGGGDEGGIGTDKEEHSEGGKRKMELWKMARIRL